ncbi:MAG: hypothetical protein WA584_14750 [Pyrinomonadaceae bacterium]
MMRVTIKITGLAYCHLADVAQSPPIKELQVLFLHPDNRHKLRLDVMKKKSGIGEVTATYNIPKTTKIKLLTTMATPAGTSSSEPIVNIDKLHYPNTSTHLSLKPLANSENFKLSYLSIPGADVLHTAALTVKKHEMWKLEGVTLDRPNGTSKTFIDERLIKTHLGVKFDINTGGSFTLNFLGQSFTYLEEDDTTYEISFDNTCPDDFCFNDFRYYYDILDGGGVKFEEIPPDTLNGETVEPEMTALSNSLIREADKETACNPVIGDPGGCSLERYFINGGSC